MAKLVDSQKYKVIGLMSGTSLDGVDIAYCILRLQEGTWSFSIEATQTVKYSSSWKKKLSRAHLLDGSNLLELHFSYGKYLGLLVDAFIMKNRIKGVQYIASHGHTVFHQPEKGYTFQLGDGNAIHAASGIPVIYDFRSLDVKLGGQGAPLVPIGDKLLFGEYDACLNLGGIANLSLEVNRQRKAYDICFVNMGLNYLAGLNNLSFDKNGKLASDGKINPAMLKALQKGYEKLGKGRPSLSREIFEKQFLEIFNKEIPLEDKLCTFTESIALEIAKGFPSGKKLSVLCTGGGSFNSFLMYRLIEHCNNDVVLILPDEETVNFKEALIFALLGALRVRGEVNCLKSVTGARQDNCGGVLVG